MGTLSVKENFHFSAALRLPSTVTREEREQRVNNVISELGLQHCADTKVLCKLYCRGRWGEVRGWGWWLKYK